MLWVVVKLLIFSMLSLYIISLAVVFFYEIKLERLYQTKKRAIEDIEKMPVSMAVINAKIFKVEEDYKVLRQVLNKRQKFILSKMPHFFGEN